MAATIMTMIIIIQISVIFGYFIEKYKFYFIFSFGPTLFFLEIYTNIYSHIILLFLQENKTLKHNVVLIVLDILVFCSPRKLDNMITKYAVIYKK